jgi:hypothetical protein
MLAPFMQWYLAMANKQKARRSDNPMVQGRNSAITNRNSVPLAPGGDAGRRRDEPLNVLGCLALIHAIRSDGSGKRSQIRAGQPMLA